ncbi:hypothetical protein PIB30_085541 [Stylosanthes scabra]|uniref:Uncharacterized protein n=1 Tax=Stylosanthes scabra TaxID=79078 RepID=A0ABU6ZRM6_9FABA|nr:hypothetical protein [Stylosanthes scabra]
MGRCQCCDDQNGLKKGPWSPEEDEKLVQYIKKHGHRIWRAVPKLAGLNRCGKSCRFRWTNYLRPDVKRGKFSQEEEQTIMRLHSTLGNRWSAIATHLPGRTDNEIKNFWNTHLKKKLIQMGLDPATHQPVFQQNLTLQAELALQLANLSNNNHHHHHQYLPQSAMMASSNSLMSTIGSYSSSYDLNSNNNGVTNNMEPFSLLNLTNMSNMKEINQAVIMDNNINNSSLGTFPRHGNGIIDDYDSSHLLHDSYHQNMLLLSHFSDPQQVPFIGSQPCFNIDEQGRYEGTTNNNDDSRWIIPSMAPIHVVTGSGNMK